MRIYSRSVPPRSRPYVFINRRICAKMLVSRRLRVKPDELRLHTAHDTNGERCGREMSGHASTERNRLLHCFSFTSHRQKPPSPRNEAKGVMSRSYHPKRNRFAGVSTLPAAGCCGVIKPVLSPTLDKTYAIYLLSYRTSSKATIVIVRLPVART